MAWLTGWKLKAAVVLLALLAIAIDFISRILSVAIDALILSAIVFLIWPVLDGSSKNGDGA